jgi:hypothetical protein
MYSKEQGYKPAPAMPKAVPVPSDGFKFLGFE